ncbi:heavy metal translocating P-type ATPase [Nocardioides zeae]|uniref:Heavy metal translocating P-type ATPase n=1 Tax=Nocardioides zeae TaxID=1457234 RepID=A0ACC6IE47_9ACTN|nr:heavy metal translocating P-type ATPase [Nocardioides zeae]MDR6174068.1 heavy metal translocating P-type ATPase [Nocardioides zeae]MDR6208875.1 heavy metal translocating P-type ATPase [Nocardioides zeae]
MSSTTLPHTTTAAARPLPGPAPLSRTIWRVAEARWATAATALFAVGGLVDLLDGPLWLAWTLYLACYVAGGWEPALAGLQALRERTLDVDVLMVVAAIAAASIGQVFDGALLIVIFATSGALEAIAMRRTQDSVRALLDLAPERATRLAADGAEEVVDTADLVPGDLVRVRPGDRIGADGTVVDGASDVDQASITGEPLPVSATVGTPVFAGTVNGAGVLTVRVDRAAAESVVARIVAMVEEASETKARTQLFIERVEQRYAAVVVVATLLLLGVPLALGAAFEPTLLRAMTFMIVASPCAIVLATMPPLLAVMANAGRHGVLLKSAVALERLAQVDRVAFDKTGTLTLGVPEVVAVTRLCRTVAEDDLVALAAAAERGSEHPVGRAVVRYAAERALAVPPATDFLATPGRGVRATVGGRVVEVVAPRGLEVAATEAVAAHEEAGRTAVVVVVDGRPHGVVALADRVRPEAPATVAALGALTGGEPVLLTGDNRAAAAALADRTGIAEVRAGLLPEEKAAAVRDLQDAGHRVALVGDGINDAPAMATAHVGVAMGRSGSDLATQTSDVVLVRDDLTALPRAVALGRRAERVVRANLAFAATVIVVLVTWDLVATLPLPLGVAGHEGSTIVVALNGLRLLRDKAWRDAV